MSINTFYTGRHAQFVFKLIVAVFVIPIGFVLSCGTPGSITEHSIKDTITRSQKSDLEAAAYLPSDQLNVLYVAADSFMKFTERNGGKNKRLIFQFIRKDDGTNSLIGWRNIKGREKKFDNEVLSFNVLAKGKPLKIKDSSVILGDNKLSRDVVKQIRDTLSRVDISNLILAFNPVFDTARVDNKSYIRYNIHVFDTTKYKDDLILLTRFRTNPSPPASTTLSTLQ